MFASMLAHEKEEPRARVARGERFWSRERSFMRLRRVIRVIFRPPQEEIRERIWSSLLLGLAYWVISGSEAAELLLRRSRDDAKAVDVGQGWLNGATIRSGAKPRTTLVPREKASIRKFEGSMRTVGGENSPKPKNRTKKKGVRRDGYLVE